MFRRPHKRTILLGLGLLVIGVAIAAGVLWSPAARKARHLERADRYFSQEQYRQAIIEYRNVLQIEATNARSVRQLGLAHYQLGEMGHALRYLARSQELGPNDVGVRLKLATIYLLTRRPDKQLAEHKVPRRMDMSDEMPRGALGKIKLRAEDLRI